MLGLGLGYLEEEFAALGVPMAERVARFGEYLAALRTLWGPSPLARSTGG